MEGLLILLLFLLVFIVVGAIVAFVAMGRTTNLMRNAKLDREFITELTNKLLGLSERISRLEGDETPASKRETPPGIPELRQAERTEPLAPVIMPPIVAPLDKTETPPTEPTPDPVVEPEPLPTPAAPPELPTSEPSQPKTKRGDWANFESAAGKRWLTWAGVVILFLSAAFFLEHMFAEGWIGPGVQVLLAIAGGVALLGAGEYFLHQEMRPLGRGLIGGGIMILYAALFAAYSPGFYKEPVIESQTLTFALMCVVTAGAMALAIRHDAISISFLAVLGGMLTPILVSKGTDARDALFAYILLLDLGVLGVAFYKKWRALDILAFVGTGVLYWGWWSKFGAGAPVGPPLAWLGTFWAVFAIIPVAHHLRSKTKLTIERLAISLANATYAFAFAYKILEGRPEDLSWAVLIMAASYLALGVLSRLRSNDAKAMFGFISLSMMFLTLFAPLQFALNGATLAWLAEAVVLVYLGYLFDYRPVRIGGFVTLLLGVGRIVNFNFPLMIPDGQVIAAFANRNFWTMMCAPIAAAMVAAVHQAYRRKSEIDDRMIQAICTIGSGLLALVLVSFEVERWFVAQDMTWAYRRYMSNCSMAILWALGATAFLSGAKTWIALPLRIAGMLPLTGALILIGLTFGIDLETPRMLALNPRFGATILVCGVMWAYSLTWSKLETKTSFTIGAALITLGLLSLELDRWFFTLELPLPYRDYLHHCSMATLWSLGAMGFVIGAKYDAMRRPLRLAALLPLCAAAVLIGYTFTLNPGALQILFINPLFTAAAILCAAMWIYSLSWRHKRDRTGFCLVSSYATVALLCAEIIPWVWRMAPKWEVNQEYTAWWAATTLLAACAAVYLAVGRGKRIAEAYSAGLTPLIIAWVCALQTYLLGPQGYSAMFLNPRFVASLATLVVIFAWATVMRSDKRTFPKTSQAVTPLYVWFTLSLLVLLSIEPAGWLYSNISDPRQANWTAQMAITIVWGVYASSMLSIGFWRRVLALRLAALALFAMTAVKLLIVDLANVRQIYRIVSFLVMGLLMIAASYLYHKAEKQLKKNDQYPQDGRTDVTADDNGS